MTVSELLLQNNEVLVLQQKLISMICCGQMLGKEHRKTPLLPVQKWFERAG